VEWGEVEIRSVMSGWLDEDMVDGCCLVVGSCLVWWFSDALRRRELWSQCVRCLCFANVFCCPSTIVALKSPPRRMVSFG
jgi:hypothetical protein